MPASRQTQRNKMDTKGKPLSSSSVRLYSAGKRIKSPLSFQSSNNFGGGNVNIVGEWDDASSVVAAEGCGHALGDRQQLPMRAPPFSGSGVDRGYNFGANNAYVAHQGPQLELREVPSSHSTAQGFPVGAPRPAQGVPGVGGALNKDAGRPTEYSSKQVPLYPVQAARPSLPVTAPVLVRQHPQQQLQQGAPRSGEANSSLELRRVRLSHAA